MRFPNFLLARERYSAAVIAATPRAIVNFLKTVELKPVPKRVVSTGHSLEAEVAEVVPEEAPEDLEEVLDEVLEEVPEEVPEQAPEEAPEEVDVAEVVTEIEGPNLVEVEIHRMLDHLNGS
jgi:hypothetical protein